MDGSSVAATEHAAAHPRSVCVRRRRVFYVPGFDPFPPRRYRELFRREAAQQAAISEYSVELLPGAPRSGQGFGWSARARIDGQECLTEFEVLTWEDIVQGSMAHSIAATYVQLLRTAWVYLSTGALFRLCLLRLGPVIAALYPVVVLLAQALLALGLTLGVAVIAGVMHPWASLLALPVFPAVLIGFKRADGKFLAYYLMHDYAFAARWRGANAPALEHRMRGFSDRLAEALRDPSVDEILIVGHSSGAQIAVSVLSDVLRTGRLPEAGKGPDLSLLTLGQAIPMMSFLPRAGRLRRDLATLATSDAITWVDISAPGDGASFALCDPVAVSGAAPGAGRRWPLVLSCAFSQTLSPARWAELKRSYFRLHFQYLCAFDFPDHYDYFRITLGSITLRKRYADRSPSPSRIVRARSGYRSLGP